MSSVKPVRRRSRLCRALGAPALLDRLESRLLLAGQAAVWRINGTAHADVIEVSLSDAAGTQLVATLNGSAIATRAVKGLRGIRIDAGAGNDQVTVDLGTATAIGATVLGGSGDDTLTGGAGRDLLLGGAGRDQLNGGLGGDKLDGGPGNDLLAGDEGNDLLLGDDGQDTLAGGLGNDGLHGGTGNDKLTGGFGDDILRGEVGRDVLRGGDGRDAIIGGAGIDLMYRASGDRWSGDRTDVWRNDFRANPLKPVNDLEAFKQRLIDQAVVRYANLFGQPAYAWWRWPVYTIDSGNPAGSGAGAGDAMSAGSSSAPDHSSTNTQVQGVDESDRVKTDGNYIYLVQDQQLLIVDAWPADESHVVSRTDLGAWGSTLYLDGTHLTVISMQWIVDDTWGGNPGWLADGQGGWSWTGVSGPTAGDMAAQPPSDGSAAAVSADSLWIGRPSRVQTVVTVYDVSDAASPAVLSTTTLDGSLNASRDIDGRVYVVLESSINIGSPQIVAGDEPDTYVYESEDAYRARLEGMTLDELLPSWQTVFGDGSTPDAGGSLVEDSKLYAPQALKDPSSLFSVVTIQVSQDAPGLIDSVAVMGMTGQVYMSAESLYVASSSYDAPMGFWAGDLRTDLYRFAVTGTGVQFEGAGQVPGWVLNSYAMDEYNGYLRIATTTQETDTSVGSGDVWPPATTSNNIFTIQDQGDTLEITGAVTGLALSERIYAARFVQDRAYLVTFRQIDPLFTVDLSDPTRPTVAGELEMPGYSSYLQAIDDHLLFGIGRDANGGRTSGLQVSLFDVSDFANPQRIDIFRFSSTATDAQNAWWFSWTSSPAEWDPHAISYFADQQILALPVLDWGWWNGDAKLELLKVDPVDGFTEVGQIHHDGEVQRSVRIGEFLYSIGTDAIKVVALSDPSQELADVVLQTADGGNTTGGGAVTTV